MSAVNIGTLEGTLILRDKFTSIAQQANIQLRVIANQADLTGAKISSAGDNVNKLGAAFKGLAVVAGITAFLKSVYQNTAEAEKVMAQLEVGVRSTGGAAGLSAEQLAKMAGELQRLTAVEDEAIMQGQSILITFTKIGKDVFPRAIKASLDLSARLGSDLSSAALQVGKALNDPIRGVTALGRAGVQLSESQKNTIKSLVETGQTAKAQEIILKELETQVGNSAEAFRDTLPGAIAALRNSWGDLLEEIGRSGESGGFFRTGIEGMVSGLDFLVDNWHIVEATILETLADISVGVTAFVALSIQQWENLLRALRALAPVDFGVFDGAISRIEQLKKSVAQTGIDLNIGFKEKAKNALEAGLKPAKELDGSFKGLVNTTGELSGDAKKLAEELSAVRSELSRSTTHSKKLAELFGSFAGNERIEREKRDYALRTQYLKDVDKFGTRAADSLKELRAAQFDAAKAADEAEKDYNGVIGALEELDKITRDLMSSSGGMGDALKKALDINVTKLNDSVDEMLRFIDAISQIDEDLDFEVRLSTLDDLSPHLREVEVNFLNLLRTLGDGSVAKGEEIFAEMANALGISIDQIKAKLGELSNAQAALRFKGASLTSRDIFKAEKLEIERLVKAGALSVADGQAAINQSTQQFWSEQLNNWGSALDFLEQRFGSFFGYLNQAVSALQQAQGFGQSISSIAGGFGASAGTMAALGAIGTTLGIFAIIYDVVDKIIEKRKTQKFGTQLSFDLGDGSQAWDDQGNEIIKSIQDLIAGIEEALDISIDDLAEIGLKVRNDGEAFKLYFKGVLIDTYGSLDEALQEALRIAITDSSAVISGMSELMAEGLSSQRFSGFEDMMEFLSQLREISDLGASAGIIDLRGVIRNFDDLWKTLQRLRSATESVIQGYNNLVLSEINTWRSLIDSVTGRQPTEQELLERRKQELAIIRTEIELRKAVIKQRILEIEATIAAIKAGNMLAGWPGGGGGNIGGGGGPGGGGLLGVAHAFAVAGAAIAQTGVVVLTAASVLTQEALDMIAALEAEADALRDLLAGLEGLVIPDPESLRPGRSGGGGSDRQSVRDFIDTRTLELALSTLGEYSRKVEEIRIQYDQLLLQAGKDISLRSQLIELRERELRILAQEQAARTVDSFRSFLGLINPFEQIRDTAADLIKEIEDSPFGDERKARMIGRVLTELDRQIEEMAREGAASLFGDMLGDLEAYGASEELMMQARQHMAILEHTLKMEHYRAQIAILKAQGVLAPEIIATLEESFRFLESIDISAIYPFDVNMRFKGYDNVIDATDRFGDELKRARDLLKKYQTDGLDPLTRNLQAIVADFRIIRDQLGDTQDVMTSYARAVNRALSDFLDPITSLQRDLFFGESSTAGVLDKWQQIQIDLATALDQFRAGNLSVVEDIPGLINQFMGIAALVSPIGSEGFKGAENIARAILNEISLLSIEDVGDIAANPIDVNGIADLEVLSEAQLDALNRIYDSSEGVAMAIDNLSNTILFSSGGLSNVA